jgi:hypothetical protein
MFSIFKNINFNNDFYFWNVLIRSNYNDILFISVCGKISDDKQNIIYVLTINTVSGLLS